MENKKTLASEMYEQESKEIESAINTLNKLAENNKYTESDKTTSKIDHVAEILEYLECRYSGAKTMNDVKLMLRLSRAIVAFSYDGVENMPTWDRMLDTYMHKEDIDVSDIKME